MAIEIEHKYIVKEDVWAEVTPDNSVEIKQGYLLTDPEKTVRIRTKGVKGYITIKGKNVGASRLEFEYEIPVEEAKILLNTFCSKVIEKIRHVVSFQDKIWEIDEFLGDNLGLMIAEIELNSENEAYYKPNWVGEDVTNDMRYANSNLSINPFKNW